MSEATAPAQPNPYRRLIYKAFEEAIPLNCQIEITYRCNHLCTFCYNSPSGEREMTTEQIFVCLRKISDLGVLYVTLTGGEALCHKDFFKIAAEVRRLEMALRLFSNGYLLANPEMVQRVKALAPMEVEISIHGARPETHDALTRIKGSFVKTLKAVENLVAANVKTTLKCPITRLNQTELLEIKAIASRLGCFLAFDPTMTAGLFVLGVLR
jgi:MoaA/NifB/PqqE/SkfB family radical SAM enzyme